MAMNLTDSGSNMHSEEQQNPEQVAKFNITFRLYASTMKRKAYAILRDEGWAEDAVQWTFMKLLQHLNQIGDPYSIKARCYIKLKRDVILIQFSSITASLCSRRTTDIISWKIIPIRMITDTA